MLYDNIPSLKPLRRILRRDSTEAEKKLWSKLRNKQLLRYKFYRQYSIDHYILDFYCPQKKLAVELDGGQHAEYEVRDYDKTRTIHLESNDVKVIRFWNSEVMGRVDDVLQTIVLELEK